ncbi:MAG: NAD(P)-dependent oxidoreductase [Pseudomonadota bacterium]
MDILLLDALVPEAMAWLEARHQVEYRPEFADDLVSLRQAAYKTRGIVFPRQTVLTRDFLDFLPKLKAVARLHVGTDNTDLDACKERDIKVIHASSANVRSNAEYLLSCLLLLYRRGVVSALMGRRHPSAQMGRELSGSTVGILGLAPTAHTLAGILNGLGVRLIGYDPAVHHTAPIWERLRIQPVTLPELMSQADAVSVQMLYASRFKGFVSDKLLAACKRNQLWVGISRSELFNEAALAAALTDGRIEACILDGASPDFLAETSPLNGIKNLFITPRLGSHTREARLRSSWYVAHRLHEAVSSQKAGGEHVPGSTMEMDLPGAGNGAQWAEPEVGTR